MPQDRLLRWAYAGHPPALSLRVASPAQGVPLGLDHEPEYAEGTLVAGGPLGVMLYTDGLTEARHDGELFGLGRVRATLGELADPAPARRSKPSARASPSSRKARSQTSSAWSRCGSDSKRVFASGDAHAVLS